MTDSTKHSPTPWYSHKHSESTGYVDIYSGDKSVHDEGNPAPSTATCYVDGEANAAFIVRAVNSHAAMVSALSDGEAEVLDAINHGFDAEHVVRLIKWGEKAREALKNAGEM